MVTMPNTSNPDPLDYDLAALALEEQAPRLRYDGTNDGPAFDDWIAEHTAADEPAMTVAEATRQLRQAAGQCTCLALRKPHRWGIKWCLRPTADDGLS